MHSVDVPNLDTSSVLSLIAQEAARATGASGVAIAIGNARAMCCCASVGEAPPVGAIAGPESGLSGLCMRTSELVHCDDAASDPRVDPTQQLRSVLIVPVITDGRIHGMLQAVSPKPRAFSTNHRELLCRMSERIAAVLGDTALESMSAHQATKPSSAAKPNIAVVPRPSLENSPEIRVVAATAADGGQKAALSPVVRYAIIGAIAIAVVIGGYELTRIGGSSSANPAASTNATPAPAGPPDVAIEQSSLAVALEQRSAGQSAAQLTPGKLLKRVDPVYPPTTHGGAVVLNAVVNKDGRVGNIRLVRGPEELAAPAIDAVHRWVYEPYRIGSTPVDVESTIMVKVTPRKAK